MYGTIENRVLEILKKVALKSESHIANDHVDLKQREYQNEKRHKLFIKHLNYASKMFDKKYKKYFTGDEKMISKKLSDLKKNKKLF